MPKLNLQLHIIAQQNNCLEKTHARLFRPSLGHIGANPISAGHSYLTQGEQHIMYEGFQLAWLVRAF